MMYESPRVRYKPLDRLYSDLFIVYKTLVRQWKFFFFLNELIEEWCIILRGILWMFFGIPILNKKRMCVCVCVCVHLRNHLYTINFFKLN